MIRIFKTPCKNCLFSKDRIVSPKEAKRTIDECLDEDKYFVCHVSSMNDDKKVCCKKFFDVHGMNIKFIEIMTMLKLAQFIDQPETEKLTPYKDFSNEK